MKILPIFFSLILITYGLIGIIQVVAGLFAYFLIMTENGFLPSCLFDLKKSWESKDVNNLQNSYGQEWVRISPFILLKENLFFKTDEQRKQLEFTCYTAFFITIIICQWATLIIFKTRRDSIMQQSMK
jgi:sodium/potassium-transporting ATPase subunit alpha